MPGIFDDERRGSGPIARTVPLGQTGGSSAKLWSRASTERLRAASGPWYLSARSLSTSVSATSTSTASASDSRQADMTSL